MSFQPIKVPAYDRFTAFFKQEDSLCYPLWMMRQAGRYLPEYQDLRHRHGSFLTLCSNPELAAEITLQPLRRFELDAAIIFADILLPLMCFNGIKLHFDDRQGPQLLAEKGDVLKQCEFADPAKILSYVGEAILLTKQQLSEKHALIGFCGGPWTVALYALERGVSNGHFKRALDIIANNPEAFLAWLDVLGECFYIYLEMQIKAGANQIMLFESWSALCPAEHWMQYVYEPACKIIHRLKLNYPLLPIIYYPKESVKDVLKQKVQPFDVIACDHSIQLKDVFNQTSKKLQGNFNPALLLQSKDIIENEVSKTFADFKKSVIVNLGQGIDPATRVHHVDSFVAQIRHEEKRLQSRVFA